MSAAADGAASGGATNEARTAAAAPAPGTSDAPRRVDVLVVGGGLGGLATAIALQQLGHDWLLAEAAPELRTATGTLIGLGDNGFTALGGISPAIPPALKAAAQLGLRSETHVRPQDGPASIDAMQLPTPLYTIHWAATQGVLADLVDRSRVLCGHKCTGYTPDEDGQWVAVHFKGQPDIRARFVVGADGVGSGIRRSMCPGDPGPRFLGFMNWNAVRLVPGSSAAPGSDVLKVVTDRDRADPHGRFTLQVYLLLAGRDFQFWQVRAAADQPDFTNGSAGGGGVPGSKARVLAMLRERGWDDAAAEVEATDETFIYERATWDRVPLTSWSAAGGRVVLLGDAAHAMYSGPGQGARTAFEDAHQLMLALREHWPDTAAVARAYEAARIQRATVVQNLAFAMANTRESADMSDFWETVPCGIEAPGERLSARFSEVAQWLNAYPQQPRGTPGAKFASPEVLGAFNQHCAAVAAAAGVARGLAVS